MSIGKWILIIIAILVLGIYFAPGIVNQVWQFSKNTVKDATKESTVTVEEKDFGKILGFMDCTSDEQCYKFFSIDGIYCTQNKTCAVSEDSPKNTSQEI